MSALSLGVSTSATEVHALQNEQTQTLSFSFQAQASCATAEQFTSRIEQRVPRLRLLERRDASVAVSIAPHGSKVRAELLILLENKEQLTRSIDANDCESALETISVIAAVALDPGAERPLLVREVKEEESPPDSSSASEANEQSATPGQANPIHREWRIGLLANAVLGPAPSALYGGELFVNLSHDAGAFWAPGLQLGVGYSRRDGFQESAGVARFELLSSSLDFCPSQWGGASARLQFCAAFEAGALRATGTDTFQAGQEVRPWVALGAALNAGFSPIEPLWIEARLAAEAPLLRDEFLFDDSVFHQVWPISVDVGMGVAFRIW